MESDVPCSRPTAPLERFPRGLRDFFNIPNLTYWLSGQVGHYEGLLGNFEGRRGTFIDLLLKLWQLMFRLEPPLLSQLHDSL